MKDYIQAHKYSSNNREELLENQKYGCFHCLTIFDSKKVKEWTNVNKDTTLCPYCNIDFIIGEYSGYSIN